ncbi:MULTISPECIES: DUF1801 domain-containing protein [unclassified Pseudoxanthomonas]|uniref:DUF1801 domain-containing protein n=1 Tax=unclassified Pseudoxanthomonas TaxID=2645906 RepID=UPI0008E8D438|nr:MULTISPECIES: DUF1801 domain-containing protein [unclassified Pseudoxanthomonas]PPJ42970.1 DUF1801 domain-containing protein [Pseudoxanthomonas sp. KAs_5_3]SFV33807.1 protein of unknown function (DU1801) [Pseudoxanthomonas sp. YR558]
MASSKAKTVEEYLAELPEDRRTVIASVRDLVNRHLPDGYVEAMSWGMIAWEVPLSRYPTTYNKQPLPYVALAAQKQYYALYLTVCYANSAQDVVLRNAYADAGMKLDMGKSCLRFKKPDDLLPEVIGRVIASTPVDTLIAQYEASRART